MTVNEDQADLIILTADRSTEFALAGILSRPQSLGIRPITFNFYNHPEKDPGCFLTGHDFLRPFSSHYRHALVIFDQEGCGQETSGRESLEQKVADSLSNSGWGNRAQAIIIDPELEIWVWSDSRQVDIVLGWQNHQPCLRSWLLDQGFLQRSEIKPSRPKEAFRAALRQVRKPLSPAIFSSLAQKVSLGRCTDPSFTKLKHILQQWFSNCPR
jgi:hypothetical protein